MGQVSTLWFIMGMGMGAAEPEAKAASVGPCTRAAGTTDLT